MGIWRGYLPTPVDLDAIANRLKVNGHHVGERAAICDEPMLQVDGAFLKEWVAYRLAMGEIAFKEALDDLATVIPGVKSFGQPRDKSTS
jgi:hypothetical protein